MHRSFAITAITLSLSTLACGGGDPEPSVEGRLVDPEAVLRGEEEPLQPGEAPVETHDVASVEFAGGEYRFQELRDTEGNSFGIMLLSQRPGDQPNVVEPLYADGATHLEVFQALSGEGRAAPDRLFLDHERSANHRGRELDLRTYEVTVPLQEKSYSRSLCSSQILGTDQITSTTNRNGVGYLVENDESGFQKFELYSGTGVRDFGQMGLCNDDDGDAGIWYRIIVNKQLVGGDTEQWVTVPPGSANWMYYESTSFPRMTMWTSGDDYHARARWGMLRFDDGPILTPVPERN